MDIRGNVVMKDEDKAEVVNTLFFLIFIFFPQPLSERPIVLRVPRHLSWKMVTGFKGTEEAGGNTQQATSITDQQSRLTGDIPVDWRLVNITPI